MEILRVLEMKCENYLLNNFKLETVLLFCYISITKYLA